MGRGAIIGGLAAALVVAAVALGARTDARLHRLHLPPPPAADAESGAISQPGTPGSPPNTSSPGPPGTTPAPPGSPSPAPPGSPPAPPEPPPPAGVNCTTSNGGRPVDITGVEIDNLFSSVTPITLAAAPILRVRGVNNGAVSHTIAIRPQGGATICSTIVISGGSAQTFAVTNLPAGGYEIYCTIHPALMRQNITLT